MLNFQRLEDTGLQYGIVRRAKVPGGWLVVVERLDGCGATFIPDPEHKWDGSSLP